MDFEAEGLLDDVDGDARESRRQLLELLLNDGFALAELKRAIEEHRLALLPVDKVLGGSHTATEIEESTGLPSRQLILIRRLHGLPEVDADDRVFSDEDVEAARSTKLFIDAGFDEEAIIEITRVLGEGMGRLSATVLAAFADTFLEPGDSEEQVALRFASLAAQLTPALAPILIAGFRAHLREAVGRAMLSQADLETGDVAGTEEMAICFADLVGFTRLSGQIELREVGSVAGKLARLANAVTKPPVRLIKTIGDAAMFVSADSGALVAVALSLVEAVEEADLPTVRAGIALGPAVMRAGDYYGNSVNLASRVTGAARPGSVLCTKEIRDAAGDEGLQWSPAGRHRLKGVQGTTPLYRVRRAEGS